MKIKTENLVGKQLNYAVAVSEGFKPFTDGISWIIDCKGAYKTLPGYSTDWSQAGPIIERERICLDIGHDGVWLACIKQNYEDKSEYLHAGQTALEAAMRCLVSKKLGHEVEIPGELL